MPTRGSCLCGDLSYEFEGEPLGKVLCHCLTCRKLTGSAYATAFMVADPETSASNSAPSGANGAPLDAPSSSSFRLTSKTNAKPRETTGTHETGLEMLFYGCARCPSTLYKRAPGGFPGVVIVLAGGLDGKEKDAPRATGGLENWGVPDAELWVSYRLPWVRAVEGAKQCQGFE